MEETPNMFLPYAPWYPTMKFEGIIGGIPIFTLIDSVVASTHLYLLL
jgi:hypothetical protein